MGRWGFGLPVALAAGAVTVALGLIVLGLPAYADGTVTVPGTRFPDPTRASLSFVGCQDLYQRGDEPLVPMVGRGPGRPPLGERSLGFDLEGGDAAGAMFPVDSVLLTTTAALMVHSEGPATGVAYVAYQAPADAGTARLWIGRTELATPGGAWQRVDLARRSFVWTEFDMNTHAVIGAGPSPAQPVALFAAAHGGDGPGVFTVGFGCDGTPFSIDQLQVGGLAEPLLTYDLEGLSTTVTVDQASPCSGRCTLTATLATNSGDPVPNATLILEQSRDPRGPWQPAQVVPVEDGRASATVDPDRPTFYRWRFVDRPLASGSVSDLLIVDPAASTGDPTGAPPTGGPTGGPTDGPTVPTGPATPTPAPTSALTSPPAAPDPVPVSASPTDDVTAPTPTEPASAPASSDAGQTRGTSHPPPTDAR